MRLQIFLALAIHKSLISFSLGIRLVQSQLKFVTIIACVAVFAVMAPFGDLCWFVPKTARVQVEALALR